MSIVEKRISNNKEMILERLRQNPIIQIACKKVGIGRATYYRWRKEDPQFSFKADEAITKGVLLINDMAESQLISAIRDQNMTAIIFWLKHHHQAYTTRVEITAGKSPIKESLSPKQQEAVTKALQLASLIPVDSDKTRKSDKDKNEEK